MYIALSIGINYVMLECEYCYDTDDEIKSCVARSSLLKILCYQTNRMMD